MSTQQTVNYVVVTTKLIITAVPDASAVRPTVDTATIHARQPYTLSSLPPKARAKAKGKAKKKVRKEKGKAKAKRESPNMPRQSIPMTPLCALRPRTQRRPRVSTKEKAKGRRAKRIHVANRRAEHRENATVGILPRARWMYSR